MKRQHKRSCSSRVVCSSETDDGCLRGASEGAAAFIASKKQVEQSGRRTPVLRLVKNADVLARHEEQLRSLTRVENVHSKWCAGFIPIACPLHSARADQKLIETMARDAAAWGCNFRGEEWCERLVRADTAAVGTRTSMGRAKIRAGTVRSGTIANHRLATPAARDRRTGRT